eukprot:TRINITY_DN25947_c0_g1_i1.p1 TRINITY_DN25947_c0_g1~~TRINITY_DN25947_c0_g1_i1.p1  ORF type:complete len:292 (-),score=26.29 TRINITY_DN25947_c0_g1_i1:8-790(-)
MKNHYDWYAIREFNDWGTPLIVDLSYLSDVKFSKITRSSLIRELNNAVGINRRYQEPFQLHFTGVPDWMNSNISYYYNDDQMPFNLTQESHLDMFPHERLVYLSPDSKNDLLKYNHDDIYVIGGIIDPGNRKPLTLSAAKKNNIRHARFPTKQVLGYSVELNIETCVAIMKDLKASNDMFYSLRWVPPRYLSWSNENNIFPEKVLRWRAHKYLSPTSNRGENFQERNERLNSKQYRHYYQRIMECKTREEVEAITEEFKI